MRDMKNKSPTELTSELCVSLRESEDRIFTPTFGLALALSTPVISVAGLWTVLSLRCRAVDRLVVVVFCLCSLTLSFHFHPIEQLQILKKNEHSARCLFCSPSSFSELSPPLPFLVLALLFSVSCWSKHFLFSQFI